MSDPGGDIREAIETASLGFTGGTNLFKGPVVDGTGTPNLSVFCLAYSGVQPSPFLGGGAVAERWPRVQVTVRSAVDGYAAGEAAALAIYAALDLQTIPRAIGGNYTDCRALTSFPPYLGVDERRRHRWAINFELWHRE